MNPMSDVFYRSEVRIERIAGPLRRAHLPAESEPVNFGVHGEIAQHYFVSFRETCVTPCSPSC